MKKSVLSLVAAAGLAAALWAPGTGTAQPAPAGGGSGAATAGSPAPARGAASGATAPARGAKTKSEKGAARPPSAGQSAMRERQRRCGAEWREAKAAGRIQQGMRWPQFWSACNKRLKGAA